MDTLVGEIVFYMQGTLAYLPENKFFSKKLKFLTCWYTYVNVVPNKQINISSTYVSTWFLKKVDVSLQKLIGFFEKCFILLFM